MPLTNVITINPYTGGEITSGWAYCSFSAFDWENKTARVVYTIYASKNAAYTGKLPIGTIECLINKDSTPEIKKYNLVSPGTPAVYNNEDPPVLISEEVPPEYEEIILRPSLPGLIELIQSNVEAYSALTNTLDNLMLLLPELKASEIEELG